MLVGNLSSCVDLRDVYFRIRPKELPQSINLFTQLGFSMVIIGRSGTGKTKLANLIAGLYHPLNDPLDYIGSSGSRYYS